MKSTLTRARGIAVALVFLVPLVPACQKEKVQPAAQAPAPGAPATSAAPATGAPEAPSQDATKITIGMSREQVVQIMGPPAHIDQDDGKLEWKYYTPRGTVEVELVEGQVTKIERERE